jgi:hypothetical protein
MVGPSPPAFLSTDNIFAATGGAINGYAMVMAFHAMTLRSNAKEILCQAESRAVVAIDVSEALLAAAAFLARYSGGEPIIAHLDQVSPALWRKHARLGCSIELVRAGIAAAVDSDGEYQSRVEFSVEHGLSLTIFANSQ